MARHRPAGRRPANRERGGRVLLSVSPGLCPGLGRHRTIRPPVVRQLFPVAVCRTPMPAAAAMDAPIHRAGHGLDSSKDGFAGRCRAGDAVPRVPLRFNASGRRRSGGIRWRSRRYEVNSRPPSRRIGLRRDATRAPGRCHTARTAASAAVCFCGVPIGEPQQSPVPAHRPPPPAGGPKRKISGGVGGQSHPQYIRRRSRPRVARWPRPSLGIHEWTESPDGPPFPPAGGRADGDWQTGNAAGPFRGYDLLYFSLSCGKSCFLLCLEPR
jgi:hypothetical protein